MDNWLVWAAVDAAAAQPGSQWAEQAYEAMAPVYDDFTAHHDYELWLGNLLPKLRGHGLSGRRLLDVGCGTGKSFLPMLERGWEVTACDISAAMLDLAKAKAGEAEVLERLEEAGLECLDVYGHGFDAIPKQPVDELAHSKAVYIARRASQEGLTDLAEMHRTYVSEIERGLRNPSCRSCPMRRLGNVLRHRLVSGSLYLWQRK